jgi:hypothetical protein
MTTLADLMRHPSGNHEPVDAPDLPERTVTRGEFERACDNLDVDLNWDAALNAYTIRTAREVLVLPVEVEA